MGKTKRGKGSKIMAIADCQGRPVAVHVESALRGFRTFGGSSCVTSDSPRTFSGYYTWPAASFHCEVYEMASNVQRLSAHSAFPKVL